MNLLLAYAHTKTGKGTGAVGYINETNESRILTDKVAKYLRSVGHTVTIIGVDKSNSYLTELSKRANQKKYDFVCQIHFNANIRTNDKMGNEVFHWYSNTNMKNIATQITKRLDVLYKHRGVKTNKDMNGRDAWLRLNKNPAILIETCFVDSKVDTDTYVMNKDLTAKLIAEGIHGNNITEINTIPPNKPTTPPDSNGKLYRVIVGAYNMDNAKNMKNELNKKGYKDTYIMEVK